jgi:hypothetical protein
MPSSGENGQFRVPKSALQTATEKEKSEVEIVRRTSVVATVAYTEHLNLKAKQLETWT